MIAILILAAGQSKRMRGTDKLREKVRGKPLLQLQTERAIATGAQVFVALPKGGIARADMIEGLKVQPLWIENAHEGLGVTLREAVAQLPQVDSFLVVLADLVNLTTNDLLTVMSARTIAPDALIWRGATSDGKLGHPTMFDASLRGYFSNLSGDTGAQDIIRAHQSRTHLVKLPDQRARYDLDTPEDWAAFRTSIS